MVEARQPDRHLTQIEAIDNLLQKVLSGDPADLIRKMAEQQRKVVQQRSRLGIQQGDNLSDILEKTQKRQQQSE